MPVSKQQRRWFCGAMICVLLAVIAAVLLDVLLAQWRPTVNLSFLQQNTLTERSTATLAETSGTISVTCILPQEHPAYYSVGRILRAFSQVSQYVAGATFQLAYVDPLKEPARAAVLVGQGARGTGVLFRQAHRTVFVPEAQFFTPNGTYEALEAERVIAAALSRLNRPEGLTVGWLTGHGEAAFDQGNETQGYSALYRALEAEGYQLKPFRLSTPEGKVTPIPKEMGVLLLMAPRYPLTELEQAALMEWLERGGRLLCFLPELGDMGLRVLFDAWGIQLGTRLRVPAQMINLAYGFAGQFAERHAVTRDFAEAARVTLAASRAVVAAKTAPQGTTCVALAEFLAAPVQGTLKSQEESIPFVMVAERGSRAGDDLAFRAGRVVVVGSADVATNRHLLNHASANRDLLLNIVHWLAGVATPGHSGVGGDLLALGMDEWAWRKLYIVMAVGLPAVLCFLFWLFTRRRS